METNHHPDVIQRVLQLLRQWGWDSAPQHIKPDAHDRDDRLDQLVCEYFEGSLKAARGEYTQAMQHYSELTHIPSLAGWAHVGLAFVCTRSRDLRAAEEHLRQAEFCADCDDVLRATLLLLRGTLMFHGGNAALALEPLEASLTLFGPDHFRRGHALDALGMWYAAHDDFQSALEFLRQAIEHKTASGDDTGLAVTHGQLGRLYLDWGQYDLSEHHFRADLEIARRVGDARGEAQMYNFLGNVSFAKRDFESASAYLDHSIHMSCQGKWRVLEAFARKDRALCHLAENQLDSAEVQLQHSSEIFQQTAFDEGLAHVQRATGILFRKREHWQQSETALRQSMRWFESAGELTQQVCTQTEIARTLASSGTPRPLVRDSIIEALKLAENSRRPHLVQEVDAELMAIDPDAARRHIYRRVRGQRIDQDSTSLMNAELDHVSVMFFDLQGFTAWSRVTAPEVVMLCLNQMMAAFLEPTARHEVQVIEYMGDGFLALTRGQSHAQRCVQVAIELHKALNEFNRPRRILGLSEFTCRIGISTGEVVLGNVGTFDKIDFRAVGTTVNLAARLQNEAVPGMPCIAQATHDAVKQFFQFSNSRPRNVTLKGIGEVQCWDVLVDSDQHRH